jgi:5-methyltetrahydrofolate--homocysteine methyltransferase
MWLDRVQTEGLLEAAVVYGYYPCVATATTCHPHLRERRADRLMSSVRTARPVPGAAAFTFPASIATAGCLADFFRARAEADELGGPDVIAFQLVTMGPRIALATGELFAKNAYRDYLELHGLSDQLTEALAELWHARVRTDLESGGENDAELSGILRQGYRGSRYSSAIPPARTWPIGPSWWPAAPGRIGVELSEEPQLHPGSPSTPSVHHPEPSI